VMDSKGVLVQVSPSSRAILGYFPEEMIGLAGAEFIHPEYLEQSRQEMRATRRGQRPKISDTRVFHKDGHAVSLSWLGAWSEPVKRYFFVGRDMTESRLAQESLRESEQLARGIIDTALDAFVQMDETGTIVDWNSQAEKIFGWPRGEALGQKLGNLIVPEIHRDAHRAGLEHFLRTGETRILGQRLEIEALRRDGKEIKVELSITELHRRGGIVFNGFIRDLTDKIAAEDRVRHAEKMEAVGQLTGGIAHDFNNILTVITGTIEILGEAVADQPQLAAITKMIDEAAARGAELTQHLLAFARKQPLQPRETDINTLIIDTAKLLRPALGEPIEIESVFEDEFCFATVDPNQLATALLNLALNARDAMPHGGKLIIETGTVFLDENYAGMNEDVRPGRYAMIAVSDTGAGIPAAILDKVFDPFFTSKGPGKGTGLGLSMVYGFVKQSAGHIKIYSEEGHGTTIRMYLPPATGAALATEAAAPIVQGGTETILVVEDDKLVRDYVLTQLQALGYVTLDAANAAEALAIVDAGHRFDLLFTDVIMPGSMNGRQLADEIEQRRPGLKVLYTSGYTENAIIHHGRLDSGVLLLAKPYRKSDLAGMVRTALGG
jgi:PAS domain S-box-containing protein